MNKFAETILDRYFHSHKSLIDAESVDDKTVVVSFPMYYSANHRVELSVSELQSGDLQISDMARTIGELRLAGISISGKTRQRIINLAKNAQIRFIGNNMVRECKSDQLGDVLHLFADCAKTVGDAYLVHRSKSETEDELRSKVRRVLIDKNFAFKESEAIKGEIESHEIDFFIPPNGRPGVALSVLPKPTRLTAEAWAFKATDIKSINKRLRVGLVYGIESGDIPKEIITKKIDIAIPSSNLEALENDIKSLKN